MKTLTALLVLLLPALAVAESDSLLKKSDPEKLNVEIAVNEQCPITVDEVTDVVHGVLIRSRIKPFSGWAIGEVFLRAYLHCANQDGLLFMLDVNFFEVHINEDIGIHLISDVILEHQWGSYGSQDKSGILAAVKRHTEDAITEYLIVNFDLGGDDE